MIGETIKLLDFLEPSRTRFIIPLYQRNYDWKEENCHQLFEDLVRLHDAGDTIKSHFFGSIVTRQESLSSKNVLIIDGQQRITTLTLLMAALINAYKDGKIVCNDSSKSEIIWEDYLYEKHFPERKYKLQPIERDRIALDAILDHKELINNSNITRNYQFFYEWITQRGLSLDDLYNSMEKLLVINISLDENDDPQLIFESINSTGLDLSEADKIRNFFLMSLNNEQQEYYYKTYWNPIEEYTNYSPTMFMRDYLTIKQRRVSKIEELYHDFKRYVFQEKLERNQVLEDMLPYAKTYNTVITANVADKAVAKKLRELRTLDSTVDMPFYISFLRYAEENNLKSSYVLQVLDVVENYWARRIICNLPTNALNKVFSTLHSDVLRIIDKQKHLNNDSQLDYLEILKYILLHKQGTSEYPRDIRVKEDFKTRQIYQIPLEYRYFIFERMENKNGKELMDIVKSMKEGYTTIEHIMPQTLTAQWSSALGENALEIHEKYLHTFGNLTLTGYNSNYSNRTFEEKKKGYFDKAGNHICGFDESAYRLSAGLKFITQWTEAEIINRGEAICQDFLKLWPEIVTTFVEKDSTDVIIFDPEEKDVLTGRNIIAYSYNGITYSVKTWKDMLVGVCSIISKEHPIDIIRLCSDETNGFLYISKGDAPTRYSAIGNNCYVWSSNSTYSKMVCLANIFDACSLKYSLLEFNLRPQDEMDIFEDIPDRYLHYQEFWEELIAIENARGGKFSGLINSRKGSLNKQINGININLVINSTDCRVEYYTFYSKGKNKNKELFDNLVTHKQEIEDAIGESLLWQRLDDKTACRISIVRNMSYLDMNQRNSVIDFLLKYGNKFVDVFCNIFNKYQLNE